MGKSALICVYRTKTRKTIVLYFWLRIDVLSKFLAELPKCECFTWNIYENPEDLILFHMEQRFNDMATHNEIGRIGEDIASKWLISRGFTIVAHNYLKKYGEIDIVARGTAEELHFVEVKTVSYETKGDLEVEISRETYRPEEKVHKNKQDRLKRTIQSWIQEKQESEAFQIDILLVYLVPREKYARVKAIWDVVFE